jgi:hypothetical protein
MAGAAAMILTDREVRDLVRRRGLCHRCTERKAVSRKLCSGCYDIEHAAGRLDRWGGRVTRPADEVLDDWYLIAPIAPEGTSFEALAERIGVTPKALARTLTRARARGDRRAVYHTEWARRCAEAFAAAPSTKEPTNP